MSPRCGFEVWRIDGGCASSSRPISLAAFRPLHCCAELEPRCGRRGCSRIGVSRAAVCIEADRAWGTAYLNLVASIAGRDDDEAEDGLGDDVEEGVGHGLLVSTDLARALSSEPDNGVSSPGDGSEGSDLVEDHPSGFNHLIAHL